jgi:hypothetical protein
MILLLPGDVMVDGQQAITQTIQTVPLPHSYSAGFAELPAQLG